MRVIPDDIYWVDAFLGGASGRGEMRGKGWK